MDAVDTAQLLVVTFVIGITAEAITAALAAGKQKMDLFGVVALAALTALGGGTIRDMVLDTYPLTWVEQPIYLIIVVVTALVTVSLSFLMH
ncbi:MAG: trimeric intracellular cation channel family protein, partial [Corynebacterium pollutisoli]|nr:trimeric intracellular cation channel family protein [Corynebacterium pollutisoli]